MEKSYKELLPGIKALAFDVDGVMTDGSLLLLPGDQVRTMNIKDGYAVHQAVKAGYHVFVISGGAPSKGVKDRLEHLGVQEIHLGVNDKAGILNSLLSKYRLQHDTLAYMGDDLPDHSPIQLAAIRACPSDAATEIKSVSNYISPFAGGKGCVRDVIEQVMRAQHTWPTLQSDTK